MKSFVIFLLLSISIIELVYIIYFRAKANKISLVKFNTPCGQCFNEAAYQSLQDRKSIIKTSYILCNEIPATLYSSHRKRAIAEEACKKYYSCLKDNLEKI